MCGPTGGATLDFQDTAQLFIVDDESLPPPDIFAVTTSNNLLRFNSLLPGMIISAVPITGLQLGEIILGIDFRPANGQLYAIGSTNRLYTIDTTMGAATQVGSARAFTLSGSEFGVDFNPVPDRLRVVSDAEQNLRINPNNGTLAGNDTPLAYVAGDPNFGANPNVTGAAYTNNFASATQTTLYGIDSNLDVLVRQGGVDGAAPSPNGGQLSTIGALGFNTTGLTGLDIRTSNNAAYASLTAPGATDSSLYTINLATGGATLVGAIGGSELIRDIAIAPAGTLQFSVSAASVAENAGKISVTVNRTGDTTGTTAIDVTTADGTATQVGDYTIRRTTLTFNPGETSKSLDIFIIDDAFVEGSEVFTVSLSNPTNEFTAGVNNPLTLTITDNDAVPGPNPIDNTGFFVRQHYLDFLNREPDAAGLAFWIDNINKCSDPARRPAGQTVEQCIDKQRETTSSAFFLSPEFQLTGGFVYQFYKGSLVGLANYDGGSAGRFPLYLEFMKDAQQVSAGIIVAGQLSAAVLEANRAKFANDFVQRAEFRAIYDPLNNTQYVDRLFQTTGITPTASERQALVDSLNNMTETRATVLRKVVDGSVVISEANIQYTTTYGKAFVDQEFRRKFVLMEYFGYLRRDPDQAGFVFWLGKLNAFNGDFFKAEMVRAFIISPEYRQRFGQP